MVHEAGRLQDAWKLIIITLVHETHGTVLPHSYIYGHISWMHRVVIKYLSAAASSLSMTMEGKNKNKN